MNLKRILIGQINGLTNILESFENRKFAKSIYHLLKYSKRNNLVTIYKQEKYGGLVDNAIIGYENVGIVFQGPVMKSDNFTIETILLLRKWYPDIKIVLSTWKNMLTDKDRELLTRNQCFVIESQQMPEEHKGKNEKIGHLNNQILSSRLGIEYLYEQGIDYVMKVRSDLRVYRKDFIPYLLNLLTIYSKAEYRLINVAFSNSLYNIPFHMSDFVWFGKIEEMRKMYSINYRNKKDLSEIISYVESEKFSVYKEKFNLIRKKKYSLDTKWYNEKNSLPQHFMTLYHEEIYLSYNYCNVKKKIKGNNLLEEYYKFLSKIIIVDDQDLLIYWNKSLYSVVQSNYSKRFDERLSHSKWLEIYLKYGD